MPKFSQQSLDKLSTIHITLQNLFKEVITRVDCRIDCGYRGEEEQNKAFAEGRSKIQFPHGKHNSFPSLAVDVYPYPYDYEVGGYYPQQVVQDLLNGKLFKAEGKQRLDRVLANYYKFYFFAGIVKGISWELGIKVRWGGDWDSDNDLFDQNFNDLPHWELVI